MKVFETEMGAATSTPQDTITFIDRRKIQKQNEQEEDDFSVSVNYLFSSLINQISERLVRQLIPKEIQIAVDRSINGSEGIEGKVHQLVQENTELADKIGQIQNESRNLKEKLKETENKLQSVEGELNTIKEEDTKKKEFKEIETKRLEDQKIKESEIILKSLLDQYQGYTSIIP